MIYNIIIFLDIYPLDSFYPFYHSYLHKNKKEIYKNIHYYHNDIIHIGYYKFGL